MVPWAPLVTVLLSCISIFYVKKKKKKKWTPAQQKKTKTKTTASATPVTSTFFLFRWFFHLAWAAIASPSQQTKPLEALMKTLPSMTLSDLSLLGLSLPDLGWKGHTFSYLRLPWCGLHH